MHLKTTTRKICKARWQEIPPFMLDYWSDKLSLELLCFAREHAFDRIFTYSARVDEIDVNRLIKKEFKICLPVICAEKTLEFSEVNQFTIFEKNKMNILEPFNTERTALGINDLLVVPGIAFDKLGFRLGKGAGYYDRFLEKNKSVTTCGITLEAFLVESIFPENHDIAMNYILTEKCVRRCL